MTAVEASRASSIVITHGTDTMVETGRALQGGAGKTIVLTGQVADALSRIRVIEYTVDSDEKWRTIIPADGITDSRGETFSIRIKDVKAGPHRIAVRATDALGNTSYAATAITIAE